MDLRKGIFTLRRLGAIAGRSSSHPPSCYKKREHKALFFRGAVDEARTRDPQLGTLMLYRLSYYRISVYKGRPKF